MARHEARAARVVPIILKPAPYEDPPWSESFGRLNVLPTGGKPIVKWRDRDEAFSSVYRSMLKLINDVREEQPQ
jgi:hypothetical protein